jgi:methionyl aminopeptidase
MTTEDVDRIVHEFIIANDAYPTPIGFMEFPKSVCTSVNEGWFMIILRYQGL